MTPSADFIHNIDNDYYYAVLNVARTATQSEIAERFRSLSLTLHPDKQLDESHRAVATEEFQKLSKAYEVLSDPFLREIYDLRGNAGLVMLESEEFKNMSRDEIKKTLISLPRLSQEEPQGIGSAMLGTDLSSLFGTYQGFSDDTFVQRILCRCHDVHFNSYSLSRAFETSLGSRTTCTWRCRLSQEGRRKSLRQLAGTVRHQFSPRLMSELSIGLIPQSLKASTKYEVNSTLVSAEIRASLNQPLANGLKLAVSRQLFEERPEVASIEIDIRQNPRYTFRLQSLATFGMQKIDDNTHLLPSTSGLKAVTGETSTGIRFQSIIPTLFVEQALNLTELALQLKLSFEYTFYVGLEWVCSGTWSPSPEKQVSLSTALGFTGVSFILDIVHGNNVFSLPFKLASEPDSAIACCGVILPAMVALLSHHLVLKPRRRKQRLQSIREARREMVESCGMRGGREAILKILKTTARKTTEAETSKEGLLIVQATWGPMYEGDDAKDLFVDVTVPLQVLVHRSQVFIPADRNKSDIRGFGDPAPFVCKVLCIRYLFRNRPHYAEIREDFPVVLPLSDHRVD